MSWLEAAWEQEALRKIANFGVAASYKRVSTSAYSTATATATKTEAATSVMGLLEEVREHLGGRTEWSGGGNPLAQTRRQRYQFIVAASQLAFDPEPGDRLTIGSASYRVLESQKDGMTPSGVLKVIYMERA